MSAHGQHGLSLVIVKDYDAQPLNQTRKEIRLLHLSADSLSGHLLGRLSIVSLLDEPVYISQSYVWGSPTSTEVLKLENETHIFITENLADVLRYIFMHGFAPVSHPLHSGRVRPITRFERKGPQFGLLLYASINLMMLRRAGRSSK